MLEKNAEKTYFDAHFHYFYSKNFGIPANYYGCSCAHSPEEWQVQLESAPDNVILSYGIHPQSCGYSDLRSNADFLEGLLQEKKLSAIGEAGFDFFTQEFIDHQNEQESAWNIQLELALKYKMPLVVHCRKANHKLFEYSNHFLQQVILHQ